MKNKIDFTSIRDILTIRYDPLEKSLITPASWKDFDDSEFDKVGNKTQNLLLKSVKKQFPDTNDPFVISLSSGIDSSLSLALIRKVFPKKKNYSNLWCF